MSMELSKRYVQQAIACVKAVNPATPRTEGFTLPEEEMPVLKDLGNGLSVVYLVDEGDSLTYVQNRHLSDTNTSPDALHITGMRNLAKISNGEATFKQYGNVYFAHFDSHFEASLILRDDLWEGELAFLTPNGFIAALPTRETLVVCDAKSDAGIATIKAIVKEAFEDDHPHLLTQQLYQRINSRWIAYDG